VSGRPHDFRKHAALQESQGLQRLIVKDLGLAVRPQRKSKSPRPERFRPVATRAEFGPKQPLKGTNRRLAAMTIQTAVLIRR